MKKVAMILCVLLSACGQEVKYSQGPKGDAGSPGATGASGTSYQPPASLEGYYELPNAGYLDLYEDALGTYTARSMRLVVLNKDGSTGLIPVSSAGPMGFVNGSCYSKSNINYVALTHNVKQDDGTVLVGTFYTELEFSRNETKGINIRVKISNSFSVVFDKSVISE